MATTPTRPAAATLAGPDAAPAPAPAAAALSSPAHIIELADQLSACADQIHERVMKEIRSYQGGPVPEGVQATARALLEDETLMRQRANSLYADAAAFIVKGLGKPQAQLARLTADAAEKIRKIAVIGEATGLVGGLLTLAGAAITGQPMPLLAAIEKVEKHSKALGALKPKPTPPVT
ncbi:hypothetical protein [Massilia yuzhufengensis]|uniref:Uncharacterized protein n=1 Tax=Massilia yuzhufengensis TaxID=1164594 RepID=A0A1I1EZL1_9BURK|nr:hypothetical protein [Massilia yuzhufengensis]SFB92585.1 hypothetical protein SAMN05216204_102308 [Massilia yuzhufengensis]